MSKLCLPLERLIQQLKDLPETLDEEALISHLVPLVSELVADNCDNWLDKRYYQVDPEQGWMLHTLYDSPDHSRGVFVTSWLPGRGTPPHDHGSWAIFGGMLGVEENIIWRRVDDGSVTDYAKLAEEQTICCGPGDVVTMRTEQIHSVCNPGDEITLSLHVYGCHPNHAKRQSFDVENNRVNEFITQSIEDE